MLAGSVLVLPVPGHLTLRLAKQLRSRALRGDNGPQRGGAGLAAVALAGTVMSEPGGLVVAPARPPRH